jgi:hypothetical protein
LATRGRLAVGEPGWDTLTVDHPDSDLSRAQTRCVTDRVVRNSRPAVSRTPPPRMPRCPVSGGDAAESSLPVRRRQPAGHNSRRARTVTNPACTYPELATPEYARPPASTPCYCGSCEIERSALTVLSRIPRSQYRTFYLHG